MRQSGMEIEEWKGKLGIKNMEKEEWEWKRGMEKWQRRKGRVKMEKRE